MKYSIRISIIILLGIVLILTNRCSKDKTSIPQLTTKPVITSGNTSATSGGIILANGDNLKYRGVCWNTQPNPTFNDHAISASSGTTDFSAKLFNLFPNTTYYVRAFATDFQGNTGYGNQLTFRRDTVLTTFNPLLTYGSVSDVDGNSYKTIQIGTQTWMAENLKVIHYRNGDEISNFTVFDHWNEKTTGATCIYENASGMYALCGRLYNWYAIRDSRNIAPTGWHLPTAVEMNTLINYLGGSTLAAIKMGEESSWKWYTTPVKGTNTSGFTVLPGGFQDTNSYNGLKCGYWWCSDYTADDKGYALYCTMSPFDVVSVLSYYKYEGFSVRCLKDN